MQEDNLLPIFYQPFWLNIVAPQKWEILRYEEAGKLIAVMPFSKGFYKESNITMPPFTPYLGPYFLKENIKGRSTSVNSKIQKVLESFIEQIPEFTYFEQRWHPSSVMWLPFFWEGYTQSTRYTYVLDIENIDLVWKNLRSNIRTDIKKAEKALSFRETSDFNILFQQIGKTFNRQNREMPHNEKMLKELVDTCISRGVAKVFYVSEGNNIHSAAFFVWDRYNSYYLLSGSDPQFRNSGSMSFLLWKGMEYLKNKSKYLDFEGSMIKNIERYFRAFGGIPSPYFEITKNNSRLSKIKSVLLN